MNPAEQYGSVETANLSQCPHHQSNDNALHRKRFTSTQLVVAVLVSAMASALLVHAPWHSIKGRLRQVSYPPPAFLRGTSYTRQSLLNTVQFNDRRRQNIRAAKSPEPSPPVVANKNEENCVINTCRKKKCNDSVDGYCFYNCVAGQCGFDPRCVYMCYEPCKESPYHKMCITYCVLLRWIGEC